MLSRLRVSLFAALRRVRRASVVTARWLARRYSALAARLGRRPLVIAGIVLVASVGAIVGAKLAPSTPASVGPLQVRVRVALSFHPGVRLLLPPAGEVRFATHRAPFAVEASIAQVDPEGARRLIDSPSGIRTLSDQAVPALRSAAVRAGIITLVCGFAGALALSFLVYRVRWRRTAQVCLTLVGALVVTSGMAYATADPAKLAQPRFTGLLSQAPYIAGQVPNVLARLESYRTGLADIIRSVTALYATAGSLPTASTGGDNVITVLHVSDIHLNPLAYDLIGRLVTQFGVQVVIDTGDITTWGTEVESSTLSRIGDLDVPYVFVRGNHDSARTAAAVAANRNAIVLTDDVVTVAGLTIAGIGDPAFTPDSPEDVAAATGGATPSGTVTAGPAPAPGRVPNSSGTAAQAAANTQLAATIDAWDAAHADDLVEIAAVHEPVELTPLLGQVGTIFAGHTHSRATRLDGSGTRIMIEGSTGGAGITARGLDRLADGAPLPLAASLVYFARSGPQAGRVIATDSITVGGFGLSSVNLQRTVIQDDKPLVPPPGSGPAPTSSDPAVGGASRPARTTDRPSP